MGKQLKDEIEEEERTLLSFREQDCGETDRSEAVRVIERNGSL